MKKINTLSLLLIGSFLTCSVSSYAQPGGIKIGKGKGVKVNAKTVEAGTKAVKAVTLTDADVIAKTIEYVDWMDKHNPVAKDKDKYAKRLKKLVEKHTNEDGLDLNYKVYLVVDVNAFACADGSVRVCAGLMDKMTDDEIRGVIGHEIGHVKNHDSKDAFKTALLASAFRDAAASQSGVAAALSETQLGDLAEAVANAQFSQKQESKADDYGFDFLKRNGYDVNAMGSAFRKLLELQGEGGGKKGKQAFSSHPDTEKRAERMEKKAEKENK
ncbi:MAG: M48 family metallopeptidase [Chitinophagaceae bacterium]|nr:M48 family metallopeptidase [Chitinophagaceae bacterium]